MSSYILFVILGLGAGATYAILGQGLVLKYRSAGVVDFAHGAVAMFIAYVFVHLRSFGQRQGLGYGFEEAALLGDAFDQVDLCSRLGLQQDRQHQPWKPGP